MNVRASILTYLIIAPAFALAEQNPGEDPKPAGYYLSIDEQGAGSDELLRGDYAAAINAATDATLVGRDLSAYLTLCAAYIRSNSLELATAACDRAVNLANVPITTMRNPHGHTNRDGLAKAHLNRGVLRTALGETDGARSDFEYALSMDRQSEIARHNLQLNESRTVAARSD
jgi:tetratricopeptide (TPR) repeat protein